MKYSVQPNEMMGFLNMLTANDRQQKKWISAIPELNNIDFKGLIEFISKNNILNVDFFKSIDPEKYSLIDFKSCIPENYTNNLEMAYNGYHSFYEKSNIENYVEQIEKTINSLGQDSFKQMAHFYGLKNADDYTTTAYALASIDGSGSCSLSGKDKSFQLLTIKIPPDENTDIKKDVSKLFHETAHGILEDSGAEKILKNYFKQKNLFTELMESRPDLKRHKTDSTQIIVDEFLTTAFQKIFSRNNFGIESSYSQATIAIMAQKMIGTPEKPGILAKALKKGETFGPVFMKKFENEFESAVPEIEKEIATKQEKSPVRARLSEAEKEGKNNILYDRN